MGRWDRSPLGPMCDVMWARPDGRRLLLVGSDRVGRFVSAVYGFDAIEIVPLACRWDGWTLVVTAGDVALRLSAARGSRIPLRRVRSIAAARWVEAPLARRLLGVRVFGTSPSGVREWYRADRYRPVTDAQAQRGDVDLGAVCAFSAPTGFGFSEPPRRPSIVDVRPLLVDPSGELGRVVAGLTSAETAD
ncbi:MAG: hypothetical protein M3179_09865 [Actinomycetota bacterium]|nr:hypothetical protein [Actinomycetota bacterium]